MHVLAMIFILTGTAFALAVIVGTLATERVRILEALAGAGTSSNGTVMLRAAPRPRVTLRVVTLPVQRPQGANIVSLPVRTQPRAAAA